jgi:hypothetical protein
MLNVEIWVCPDYSDSWLGVNSVWFGFKGNWALIGKTGMKSDAVIEGFDVIEDSGASLGHGVEAMMIDQFVFETAKERFNKSVVVAVAFSAH